MSPGACRNVIYIINNPVNISTELNMTGLFSFQQAFIIYKL